MKWTSMIAIYFIIWWLSLFVVLPFGIQNAAETGDAVDEGNDAGAPIVHGLAWKALITTVIASIAFAIVYWTLASHILETLDIPFIKDMPKI
jgi:predicted secreted protein